jgi:hypothetical protein
LPQQQLELRQGHGLAEQETLVGDTAILINSCQLRFVFNTLGDHIQAQRAAYRDDGLPE